MPWAIASGGCSTGHGMTFKKTAHASEQQRAGKRILMGKVYRSFGTGNRWRPIADRSCLGAFFFGMMRFKLCPGSQNSNPSVWIL